VADTGRRGRVEQIRDRTQLGEVADGADQLDVMLLVDQRQAGGVVAAVLESFEAGEQEWFAGPVADVADDAADRGAS
jgi:hypothetical protein